MYQMVDPRVCAVPLAQPLDAGHSGGARQASLSYAEPASPTSS